MMRTEDRTEQAQASVCVQMAMMKRNEETARGFNSTGSFFFVKLELSFKRRTVVSLMFTHSLYMATELTDFSVNAMELVSDYRLLARQRICSLSLSLDFPKRNMTRVRSCVRARIADKDLSSPSAFCDTAFICCLSVFKSFFFPPPRFCC